jgi:hypothetical protein
VTKEDMMPCHEQIDYSDPEWIQNQLPFVDLCAGNLVHFGNFLKMPRRPELYLAVMVVKNRGDVFSSPMEFMRHHMPNASSEELRDAVIHASFPFGSEERVAMGSQRRMVQDLMKHFLLAEEDACEKVKYIEAVGHQVGDALGDAVFSLTDGGTAEGAIRYLRAVRDQLNLDINILERAFTGVKKRNMEWIKSSLSHANGNCVEVMLLPGGKVAVRNSRHPEVLPLVFTADEWKAFIGGAKNGEFD